MDNRPTYVDDRVLYQNHKGKPVVKNLIGVTILTASVGCATAPVYKDGFTYNKFNAPIGEKLHVETGESLFVEGAYIPGEAIKVAEPIDIMIPGSMFIYFPIHIDTGDLLMSRITSNWKYYCAENGKAIASFPGLGSVIRDGDCVGVRIALDGTKHQWVVDNSNYNSGWGNTIWSRKMGEEDKKRYKPYITSWPFKVQSLKRIIFDGYYSNLLHFTWEEITSVNKYSRQFTFDYKGQPVLVGIKGNQFIVHDVDNVKITYEWKKFDTAQ